MSGNEQLMWIGLSAWIVLIAALIYGAFFEPKTSNA
jgi:hypothetical protein